MPSITELSMDDIWAAHDQDWQTWAWERDSDGVIHFTGQDAQIWVTNTYTWPRFKGIAFKADFPYDGPTLRVSVSNEEVSVNVLLVSNGGEVHIQSAGSEAHDSKVLAGAKYFRIWRNRHPEATVYNDALFVEFSANGTEWWRVNAETPYGTALLPFSLDSSEYTVSVEFGSNIELHDVYGVTVNPFTANNPNPNPTPPIWNPPEEPDPYNPGAIVDAADKNSSSLLDQVRAFSSAVRRAVRITGPTTIEMVDPTVPLPAGWSNADAAHLYTSAGRSAAAETTVLSVRAGDVTLTASASMKADDVRLIKSTWRIPDRLPFYGLTPGAVQRVTYTFTPQHFKASLDFHYRDVPLEAKGGS